MLGIRVVTALVSFVILLCRVSSTCTVSGISSGAAMAVQYHVAHSSTVAGAGIIAGPPYWCANENIATAIGACMKYPDLISINELVIATSAAYRTASIDDPALLANTKVWIYSGTKDTTVNPGVVHKTLEYYQSYIHTPASIKTVFNISSAHAFITANYGNKCDYFGSPFINNCKFNAAGEILSFLIGKLNNPVKSIPQNIHTLNQKLFVPGGLTEIASLADNAYAYVPTSCNTSGCQHLHVVLHGCEQSSTLIGNVFYTNAGYNEWAEANKIVILYPQTKSTIVNPKGCWDWWGYSGADYATKLGIQIATIKNMVDHLSSVYVR